MINVLAANDTFDDNQLAGRNRSRSMLLNFNQSANLRQMKHKITKLDSSKRVNECKTPLFFLDLDEEQLHTPSPQASPKQQRHQEIKKLIKGRPVFNTEDRNEYTFEKRINEGAKILRAIALRLRPVTKPKNNAKRKIHSNDFDINESLLEASQDSGESSLSAFETVEQLRQPLNSPKQMVTSSKMSGLRRVEPDVSKSAFEFKMTMKYDELPNRAERQPSAEFCLTDGPVEEILLSSSES